MSVQSFVRSMRTAGLTLALLASATAAQAQQGSIAVRVTQAPGGTPVDQAQVTVVGTTLGGLTNAEGRFTIRGVTAGMQRVRVLRVGFGEQVKTVSVLPGQQVEVAYELSAVAVSLAPVVTTATGEQRRVEIGNAVSNIDASKVVAESPVRNIDDLLNSRTAGVVVQTGTQTGTGSRVRIRGQSSLSLGNDPIYVIDGVRMTSNLGSGFGTGGNNAGRVGDLNPDEIENIEIVKGPSAATLYGTDAANGVVVITTKRGRAGSARWNVYGEGGHLEDRNDYPYNYTIAGQRRNATTGVVSPSLTCTLPEVSTGVCTVDSMRVYAPLHDDDATPVGTGSRYQVGAQLSAGTETVRYFLSAEREEETGVLELPAFERRRFAEEKLPIRDWVERPNELARNTLRANLNASVNQSLDLSVSTGYINLNQRYSLESNATAGLGSHVFGGPGYKENGNVATSGTIPTSGSPLNGYRAWTPGYSWQEKVGQKVNRFITSANANWRPVSWNQTRFTIGTDLTDRVDDDLLYRGEGPPITANYREGFQFQGRNDIRNTTVDLGTTGQFNPRPWLNSKTTFGVQYVNYQFDGNQCGGENLVPGTQTCSGGVVPSASQTTTINKTLGYFVEQAFAINDRLFITGAVRSDQNSAFGTEFQSVVYPKASLSWITSDESWFPRWELLNSFRFRAAYGASGVQPGPNDALRTFSSTTPSVRNVEAPGLVSNALGNDELKPERTEEFETGFETKMWRNRLSFDLTYYSKRTKDALISAVIPPSVGTGATTVRQNLGSVTNQGWEFLGNAQIVDTRNFAFDLTLNASTNKNELVSLGGTPPQIGTTTRVVEGYPLFGWWTQKIQGYSDKNGDGILTYSNDVNANEVQVDTAFSFAGYTQPRHIATLTPGVELLNRRLRLQAMFDWRGGYRAYNNTERIRCASRLNCNGLKNPNASLEEQAMVVTHLNHPTRSLDGFIQDGEFTKLREVSVRWTLPQRLVSGIRARNADLVLSGRNLAVWTNYRGVDPENDYLATSGGDAPSDFQTIGPASYWVFRVNLGY
jgi:TonB-linked SusC/RagA family outer membrane protein